MISIWPKPLQGRYRLDKVLGQGGFGRTFLGYDQLLHRLVVIKELFPSGSQYLAEVVQPPQNFTPENFERLKERFTTEARQLAKFKSDHIVQVLDVFTEHGTAYIVMEHLRGCTLAQYLVGGGQLSPKDALVLAWQLGNTLAALHEAGVLHLDIKPANVMLTEQGQAVLIDFGAASALESETRSQTSVQFTPQFAPPELFGVSQALTARTDLYSLAATLMFALSGQVLPHPMERMQGLADLPQIEASYPMPLIQALQVCLALKAPERPSSAKEFLAMAFPPAPQLALLYCVQDIIADLTGQNSPKALFRWPQNLVLYSKAIRQDSALPTNWAEVEQALKEALTFLPEWHEAFGILYRNDLNLAASDLAERLTNFIEAGEREPDLTERFVALLQTELDNVRQTLALYEVNDYTRLTVRPKMPELPPEELPKVDLSENPEALVLSAAALASTMQAPTVQKPTVHEHAAPQPAVHTVSASAPSAPSVSSPSTQTRSDMACAGIQPYQEYHLPPQSDKNLLGRSISDLLPLFIEVVAHEGPIPRAELFRRVAAAHDISKVGSRINTALEGALARAIQTGQLREQSNFIWSPDMLLPPIRNRAALPIRNFEMVCDEELHAAARLVVEDYPHQTPEGQAVTLARLLGFGRLTEAARLRIVTQLQKVSS